MLVTIVSWFSQNIALSFAPNAVSRLKSLSNLTNLPAVTTTSHPPSSEFTADQTAGKLSFPKSSETTRAHLAMTPFGIISRITLNIATHHNISSKFSGSQHSKTNITSVCTLSPKPSRNHTSPRGSHPLSFNNDSISILTTSIISGSSISPQEVPLSLTLGSLNKASPSMDSESTSHISRS